MKYLDQYGILTDKYYGYVYLTIDQKHNKIYIGQSSKRVEESVNYFGSGKRIKDIRKSRGIYFLKKIILGVCYSREELLKCEYECKLFFDAFNKLYGYNYAKDDCGGDTWTYSTEESKKKRREKLSKAMTGKPSSNKNKPMSEEQKQKLKKPKTKEHKTKISEAKKGKKNLKIMGKNNPMYGRTREKILFLVKTIQKKQKIK